MYTYVCIREKERKTNIERRRKIACDVQVRRKTMLACNTNFAEGAVEKVYKDEIVLY